MHVKDAAPLQSCGFILTAYTLYSIHMTLTCGLLYVLYCTYRVLANIQPLLTLAYICAVFTLPQPKKGLLNMYILSRAQAGVRPILAI